MAWSALGTMLSADAAFAQRTRPDPNPDASIEIEQVRVGVLAVGATVGGGRLRFRGEEHRFSVRGFEIGSVCVASLSARGEVFNLRRLEDFPGRYTEQVMPRARRPRRAGDTLAAQCRRRGAALEDGPRGRAVPDQRGRPDRRTALIHGRVGGGRE